MKSRPLETTFAQPEQRKSFAKVTKKVSQAINYRFALEEQKLKSQEDTLTKKMQISRA